MPVPHIDHEDGVYDVLDARTGKVALTGPLQLPPGGEAGDATGTFAYPSLSLAGGTLFAGNTKGEWELLDPAVRDNQVAAASCRWKTLRLEAAATVEFELTRDKRQKISTVI